MAICLILRLLPHTAASNPLTPSWAADQTFLQILVVLRYSYLRVFESYRKQAVLMVPVRERENGFLAITHGISII